MVVIGRMEAAASIALTPPLGSLLGARARVGAPHAASVSSVSASPALMRRWECVVLDLSRTSRRSGRAGRRGWNQVVVPPPLWSEIGGGEAAQQTAVEGGASR